MELVERAFTETSSRTRTSPCSTLDQESCPWPMLDPTPMDLSSLCAPLRPSGWMASTSCSDRWSRAWILSRRSRALDLSLARLQRRLLSLTADSANFLFLFTNTFNKSFGNIYVFLTYLFCI